MPRLRKLGDAELFPIGLGAMQMSIDGRPDEAQSIRTIHAALDAGVNLIDTADAYARDESEVGHNERLVAKALRGRRDGVIVATKGGHTRKGTEWHLDGSPAHLRAACEASLRALETDRIDLYQYHRPDPNVPTPSRCVRSRSCGTRARSAGSASPTRTRRRSTSRARSPRSEERRVGKECRSRWSPYH